MFHLLRFYFFLVNCVANIKQPKKTGRPVTVELNPNFEILSQMRNFQIQFLDDNGQCTKLQTLFLKAPCHCWGLFEHHLLFLDCKDFCQLLSMDLTIG